MNPPKDSDVQALHACYSNFTAYRLPLDFGRHEAWERFLAAGFSLEDLQLVLKRWSFKIAQGTDAGVLRWSRLIGNLDTFAEDLGIAKAEHKIRQGPRERALQELRPIVVEPRSNGVDTKTAREAMSRGLDQVRKAIEGN